jgi:hypothetical protein
MGNSVDAKCGSCSYHGWFRTGGGKNNHTTYSAWPVVCRSCQAVSIANFKSNPLKCLKCESVEVERFDTSENWRGDGEKVVSWDNLELTDGHYRCPKCGDFELRFDNGRMLWD